jgi:hypothetical protein
MSKRKQGRRPRLEPVKPRGRRTFLIVLALGLLVAIAAVVMLLRGASGGFDKLNGRWLRPDGGYVLEIRSVDASGKIDAAYLNPNPISVSKAEATRDGSTVKVFVELRAPNYPGSTYTLTYDPQRDQLTGIYFQAVQQQNFDVSFVRMK